MIMESVFHHSNCDRPLSAEMPAMQHEVIDNATQPVRSRGRFYRQQY